ncbi:MAG: cytochrome c [Myxococcota bacterium]
MSTTLSMWLGITFLMLAIIAVLLQAWLWGPKFWNEEKKKTEAPKFWLRMHALAGYSYGIIYVFMMWHMLPRLWEYQYELPARTVFHAVLAIAIGVLLITKIMILVFFRHFEESMPQFGFGLLICTVAMTTLSVPYALQAHDLKGRTTDPDNIERVKTLLAEIDMGEGVDRDALVTEKGFARGREVLVRQCITCHDMRTILAKPRTAKGWFKVSERMLDKPAVFGDPLEPDDIPYVTAYLAAITPEIQKSAKRKREQNREVAARTERMVDAAHEAEAAPSKKVDEAAGAALLEAKCIDCHELDETENHGGDDEAGWRSVIAAMVEEGAEMTDEEVSLLSAYLAVRYPAKAVAETPADVEAPPPEPEPEPAEAAAEGTEPTAEGGTPTEAGAEGGEATPAEPVEATPPAEEPKAKKPKKPKAKKPKAKEPKDAQPKPKPKPKAPPKPKADKAAGKALFLKKCKTCHGADGKGDTPFGRKLEISSLRGTGRSQSKIRAIIANGVPGTKMKPYKGKVTDADLDNMAAFVKSLR